MRGAKRQSAADASAFSKRVDAALQRQALKDKQAANKEHNERVAAQEAENDARIAEAAAKRNTGRHHDDELNYHHNRTR